MNTCEICGDNHNTWEHYGQCSLGTGLKESYSAALIEIRRQCKYIEELEEIINKDKK